MRQRLVARYADVLAGWQVGLAVTLAHPTLDRPAYFWLPAVGAVFWPWVMRFLANVVWHASRRKWPLALTAGVVVPAAACFALHARHAGTLGGAWEAAFAPHEAVAPRVFGVDPPAAATAGTAGADRELWLAVRETAREGGVFVLRVLTGTPAWLYAVFALVVAWQWLVVGRPATPPAAGNPVRPTDPFAVPGRRLP